MLRKLTSMLLPLALVAAPVMATASEEWRTERFNVVVRDQGIKQVLSQFGALVGVPVVVSESVDALVSARFEDATGEQILEALAKEYALDWRYDGRRIEVSSNSEQVSRILDMGGVKLSSLEQALTTLGAYESRYPISAIDGELGLLVGPPRYVAIVEIVLAELVEKKVASDIREGRLRAERAEREARETERLAERARQLAEERRLLEREREALSLPVHNAPLVNRGGRWGG